MLGKSKPSFLPLTPLSQWGSQSNLFLMGKHRHEYAHTHAHTHTSDAESHNTQCSLHPESQHTLGLLQPPGRAPQNPDLYKHTAGALKTHPKALCRHCWPSGSTVTATHHGLPHGHLHHSLAHTGVRAHTHCSHSHTQTLSHVLTPNSDGLTYGYHHTLRTAGLPSTQILSYLQKLGATQSPSASHTPAPAVGNTDTHSEE